MTLEVTRNVVSDLWPLYSSGDASIDTRSLVDAFLVEDAAFAAQLRQSRDLSPLVPGIRLSPDAERQLLDDARRRARTKLLLIGGGVALAGFLVLASFLGVLYITIRGF